MPSPISSLHGEARSVYDTDKRGREIYVLNAKERVVLRDTLATRGRASLDLTDAESDDEVRDHGVLGLARTVRDHDTPAVRLRELSTMTRRNHV